MDELGLMIQELKTEIKELEAIIILERRKIAHLCKWIMLGDFDNQLRSDFIDLDFLEELA